MSIGMLPEEEEDDEDAKTSKKKYDDFMLAEYTTIAQAYFNTVNSIGTFFRSYLTFVGLPIPLLVAVLTQITRTDAGSKPSLGPFASAVPAGGTTIAVLGFFVMWYVINLRLDALLYARAVNGVRKYFYNSPRLDLAAEASFRVLPTSTSFPRYFEWNYTLSVVAVFTLIDTSYLIVGWFWFCSDEPSVYRLSVALFIVSVIIHLSLYGGLAWYRETRYLTSQIIGVDIDGVLGLHREHFAAILQAQRHKNIDPEKITQIPVNLCKELGVSVTVEDEITVFNSLDYWKNMPAVEGAAGVLLRLQEEFGYKVYIFTHRGWPHLKGLDRETAESVTQAWLRAGGTEIELSDVIDKITREWVEKQNIPCDRLVVEKKYPHYSGPSPLVRNRFTLADRKHIQLFVEDDLPKAIRLASFCTTVFLIDHPYNREVPAMMPRNLIRVKSWGEIYARLRQSL